MPNDPLYPCPACGFNVFSSALGSYDVCHVCNWEDDEVQLRFPWLALGANPLSLADHQKRILPDFPPSLVIYGQYRRAADWRPLASTDHIPSGQIRTGRDYFHALSDHPPRYYWRHGDPSKAPRIIQLTHEQAIDIIYSPSPRSVLPFLGYDFSNEGLQQFFEDRVDIFPQLVDALVKQIDQTRFFPHALGMTGTYIQRDGEKATIIQVDKPSVWCKYTYNSPIAAATAYLLNHRDIHWLNPRKVAAPEPDIVENSWRSRRQY